MLNIVGTKGPPAINNIYDERDSLTFQEKMNSRYVRTFETRFPEAFPSLLPRKTVRGAPQRRGKGSPLFILQNQFRDGHAILYCF